MVFFRQIYLAEDVSQLSGVSLGDKSSHKALLDQCKDHERKLYLFQTARVRLRVYIPEYICTQQDIVMEELMQVSLK